MVAILGMHRSGTSAVTRILHDLGVYLGPPDHMMRLREDNPVGFFEHQPLTDLNDQIIWDLKGTWFSPPLLPPGWTAEPILEPSRARAVALLDQDFGPAAFWAWKDPRLCLTLPFWRPLLPPLRCVLCLRNPIDVAQSLHRRDGFSLEMGVDLWCQYTAAAIVNTRGLATLLVSYDDVLDRGADTVDRLVRFVEWPVDPSARDTAIAHASERPDLRHHRSTLDELCRHEATSRRAAALYRSLQARLAMPIEATQPAATERDGLSW
jgi:hypothetical protein